MTNPEPTRADGKPFKGYLIHRPDPSGPTYYMPTAGLPTDLIRIDPTPTGADLVIVDPVRIGLPCAPGTTVRCYAVSEAARAAMGLLYATDWTRYLDAGPEACPVCGTVEHWRQSCGEWTPGS